MKRRRKRRASPAPLNGEVISCEYTEDPHRATGTGFAPHWGSCRAAGNFRK